MTSRLLVLSLMIVLLAPARGAEDGRAEPTPGLWSRLLHPILHPFGSGHPRDEKGNVVKVKNLILSMELSPAVVKLPDTRRLNVAIALGNKSGKFVHLEFPTTQRIEVLIRDKTGRLVTQWSEDQSFTNDASYITINPGERIEYDVSVATRDMTAGQPYTVEGFFPSFNELRIQKTIVPEK
jgi:Intracellular proteinase inhibitor